MISSLCEIFSAVLCVSLRLCVEIALLTQRSQRYAEGRREILSNVLTDRLVSARQPEEGMAIHVSDTGKGIPETDQNRR